MCVCENIWINDNWRQWQLVVVDGDDNNNNSKSNNHNYYSNNKKKTKKHNQKQRKPEKKYIGKQKHIYACYMFLPCFYNATFCHLPFLCLLYPGICLMISFKKMYSKMVEDLQWNILC